MTEGKPHICLIMGSPSKGATNRLAGLIERGIGEGGGICDFFSVAAHPVTGCIGCDKCLQDGICFKSAKRFDDFYQLEELLDACDMLVVVSPVFFSGPPSQLKAIYDRFQPYWARRYFLGQPAPEKRPASMFVVGSGNDPFGPEPLLTITRSALNVAGFSLGPIHDFIGYGEGKYPAHMESQAVKQGRAMAEMLSATR